VFKGIIRSRSAVCTSATVQDVQLDAIRNGVHIRWKQVTGIDETSATTTCQVGFKRGTEFYPFRGGAIGAAHRSIRLWGDVHLPGEFVPCARFYGATLADTLLLTAAGEVESD